MQNAAVRELIGYDEDDAPTILLYGGTSLDTPHGAASEEQKKGGKYGWGTLGIEYTVAKGALDAAKAITGTNQQLRINVSKQLECAKQYFNGLGFNNDTETRKPGNRYENKY
ncbi:MAG: hypothetical protein OHK0012_09790 [Synechococcales cyanobacterium]